jgi:ribonuclease VapC
MVVDTSILLALLFDEPHGSCAADALNAHAGELRMSTVNLAEALIRVRDRQPQLADKLEEMILDAGIRQVPPDVDQARVAAAARLRYPLNLGDCFAYALAVADDCAIMTLDDDFHRTDRPIVVPPES